MNKVKGIDGSNDLDTSMKDNPGINRDPDMNKSMGTPKPDLKKGYSKGNLGGEDTLMGFRYYDF